MTKPPKPKQPNGQARSSPSDSLLSRMRRVLTKLLAQEWPPEFQDGLVILVRRLTEIERSSAVDAELMVSLLPIVEALKRAQAQAHRIDPGRVQTFENAVGALTELLAEAPQNRAA